MKKTITAIVGTGPAGLLAASILVKAGFEVHVFEAHHSPGRKLLIAGKSGLNVGHETQNLSAMFEAPKTLIENILKSFDTQSWLKFIKELGVDTFLGSSHRYFVKGLKAAPLLKAWLKTLKSQGVIFHYQKKLTQFVVRGKDVFLTFNENEIFECQGAILALGGASWLDKKHPLSWAKLFEQKNISLTAFRSANAGFEVSWSSQFLAEAEGLPLKNILLKTSKQTFKGELTITKYGLEGTPVYNLTKPQIVHLDLKPDLTYENILAKLSASKEKMSPLRLAKKSLHLCPATLALLFHHGYKGPDLKTFCKEIKHFPIELKKQCGLETAISSAGGVCFSEVHPTLMLKAYPGVFVAGEMLDWHAPTGGFLIQGAVSFGHFAALGLKNYIEISRDKLNSFVKKSS